VLHEFCGLPYGEVAAAIGVSESAIGSLLFRARRSVRSAFRRGYAVLPLPEIWNAAPSAARGPAIGRCAPDGRKVGCGAVAVGLSAGVWSRSTTVTRVPAAFRSARRGGSGDVGRCENACAAAGGREVGALASATAIVVRSPPSVPLGRRLHVRAPPVHPTTMAGRPVPRSWSHPPRRHPATRRHPGVRQEHHTSRPGAGRRRATKHGRAPAIHEQHGKQKAVRPTQAGGNQHPRPAGKAGRPPWLAVTTRRPRATARRSRVGPIRRCTAAGVEHGPPRPPRASRAPRPPGQELSSRRDRHERDERPADKFSETRPERRPLVRGRELDRRARASPRGAKQRRRPTGVPAGRDQDDPPRPHLARDRGDEPVDGGGRASRGLSLAPADPVGHGPRSR
jgi:hypothetical protein